MKTPNPIRYSTKKYTTCNLKKPCGLSFVLLALKIRQTLTIGAAVQDVRECTMKCVGLPPRITTVWRTPMHPCGLVTRLSYLATKYIGIRGK